MNGTEVGQQTAPASATRVSPCPGRSPTASTSSRRRPKRSPGWSARSRRRSRSRWTTRLRRSRRSGWIPLSRRRPFGQNDDGDADDAARRSDRSGSDGELVQTGALTTADSSGNFSFYPVNLPNLGTYTFTVQATDVAGNVSTLSETVTRLDNTLPSNLLAAGCDAQRVRDDGPVGDTVTISSGHRNARRQAAGERSAL